MDVYRSQFWCFDVLCWEGYTVRLQGDKLMVSPSPKEADAAFIREHRDELVWAAQQLAQAAADIAQANLFAKQQAEAEARRRHLAPMAKKKKPATPTENLFGAK